MARGSFSDLIEAVRFRADELDAFLDPRQPNWGSFDAELGYVHRSIIWQDGVDASFTRGTYLPHGPRRAERHADQACRINTYGDSFTEGACVNDGETWQEVAAARLGEPLRNFGIGGHSSYQAYRLMRRTEVGDWRAKYLLLTIYLDEDSYRNIDCFRWVRWHRWWGRREQDVKFRMVHANPSCYLRFDPDLRGFVETENPFPSERSLYRLTDPAAVADLLENDLTTQVVMAQAGYTVHNPRLMRACAESLGLQLAFRDPDDCASEATRLHQEVAARSAIAVATLWMDFCREQDRVGLVATASDQGAVEAQLRAGSRSHELVAHLREARIPCFDGQAHHAVGFAASGGTDPRGYAAQLYNHGHYSPFGNFQFAQGLAAWLIRLLQPAPTLYDHQRALALARADGRGRDFALDAPRPSPREAQPALDGARAALS